ncbi:hypothetical protein [Saccharothrix obliqua]|uniref:hypothetical protein n=1 Tax=Saccharothrix obliqua TaxID=2861747 RepID=UPI001C5D68F4|nr:hypothetical protein [Saccharothrix obliqua]MBW4718061.1 hypothetical protein [Saccharothrix obliqua]
MGREFVDAEIALLERLGPRLTGTPAHEELIDHVADQWRDIGLTVHEDRHVFTRWDPPTGGGLRLEVAGEPVEVSSAFPYSGATYGVSGPLRRLRGPLPRWKAARGGIAVIEVDNWLLPMSALVGTWDGSPPWDPMRHPLVPATLASATMAGARRSAVTAVVFAWRGITPDCAHGQYVPFTMPYQDTPALFVAGDAAETVLAAAERGARAALTLRAALTPESTTRTVWTVVEGTRRPQETVLVVSHSDGVNVVEENGHIGLTALARDVVADPPERTTVFVLTTAHLRIPAVTDHGQATTRWLADHRDLWAGGRRAVAGLAIEHLGAREYRDDPATGRYGPTGDTEPELLYATTRELKTLASLEWRDVRPGGTRMSRPGPLIHFGEGEPLWDRGIPAVALVTTPQYLLSTTPGDHVDPDLLCRQVDAFRRLRRRLDVLPTRGFGTVARPNALARLAATVKVVAALLRR